MYGLRKQGWQKHLDFIALDVICLVISMFLACYTRHGSWTYNWTPLYRNTMFAVQISSLAFSIFFDSYRNILKKDVYAKCIAALKHSVFVFAFAAIYLYSTQNAEQYSRVVFFVAFGLYVVFGCFTRIIWGWLLKRNDSHKGKRILLIVTTKKLLQSQMPYYQNLNRGMYFVAGFVVYDAEISGTSAGNISVVANKNNLLEYLSRQWVDEVFIDFIQNEDSRKSLIEQLNSMGIVTHVRLLDESEQVGKKQFVERLGDSVVLTTSMNYATPGQLFLKRMMDIIGSIVGLVITAMLFLLFFPVIKIQSPGPIFFTQVRIGQNGKRFKIYKFRTMYLDAEERKRELMSINRVKDGHMFKLEFDPRVIGNRVLPDGTQKKGMMELFRSLSLDEFPQFLNVLKGDMSLVGTRPPTVEEFETYEAHHHARLACKPGLTGMWQVNGRSNITDFEDVVKLDTQYINEWNLGLDIKILFKTIAILLSREGAM